IELNLTEEAGHEEKLIARIVGEAVKNVFDQYAKTQAYKGIVEYFEAGHTLEVGDQLPSADVVQRLGAIRDFPKLVGNLAKELDPDLAQGPLRDDFHASVAEFILEGLHCHNRLNKATRQSGVTYGR